MAGVVNSISRPIFRTIFRPLLANTVNLRYISTSQKNKDGHAITTNVDKEAIPDFSKPLENKNWVSYGFHWESEKEDVNGMHNVSFIMISCVIVVGGFFYAYFPDFKERDWSQREAFLELRRREQLGLPLVDKNYIDPSLIILPSDEELGDAEIII